MRITTRKHLMIAVAALFAGGIAGTAWAGDQGTVTPEVNQTLPNPANSPESTAAGVGASATPETQVRGEREVTRGQSIETPTPQGAKPNPAPSPESTASGIGAGTRVDVERERHMTSEERQVTPRVQGEGPNPSPSPEATAGGVGASATPDTKVQ